MQLFFFLCARVDAAARNADECGCEFVRMYGPANSYMMQVSVRACTERGFVPCLEHGRGCFWGVYRVWSCNLSGRSCLSTWHCPTTVPPLTVLVLRGDDG